MKSPTWIGYSWTAPRVGIKPRIVSAQYYERPSGGVTGRIVRKLWVLDYARSDCGLARVGSPRGPWWPRRARVAHLYPPGTPYWEDSSSVRGLAGEAYAIFSGGAAAGLQRLIGKRERFARIADPAGRLEALLHEAALAGQSRGESGFWPAQAALAALFGLLGEASQQDDGSYLLPPAATERRPAEGLVEEAGQFFRAHLAERVTLAAVARHLGMSPSALSHRYAEAAGGSPMAALAALRIELGKSLLLRGLKMETIARQTGFCDAFHFSKAFKKHCGTSPSEFRRALWRSVQRTW